MQYELKKYFVVGALMMLYMMACTHLAFGQKPDTKNGTPFSLNSQLNTLWGNKNHYGINVPLMYDPNQAFNPQQSFLQITPQTFSSTMLPSGLFYNPYSFTPEKSYRMYIVYGSPYTIYDVRSLDFPAAFSDPRWEKAFSPYIFNVREVEPPREQSKVQTHESAPSEVNLKLSYDANNFTRSAIPGNTVNITQRGSDGLIDIQFAPTGGNVRLEVFDLLGEKKYSSSFTGISGYFTVPHRFNQGAHLFRVQQPGKSAVVKKIMVR